MSAALIPGSLTTALLAGLLSLPPAAAQTAADSAASAATGVYPAPPVAPDTGRSAGDSARADLAAPSGPIVVNVAPPDTILMAACAGAPPGSTAEGILAVVFRSGSTDREKAAAAKSVGGVLAGPATGTGEEYVRLTAEAPSVTVAADRLILQDAVTRVSPAPCPPPVLPPASPSAPAAPASPATPPGGRDTTPPGGSIAPDSAAAPAPGPSAAPPR